MHLYIHTCVIIVLCSSYCDVHVLFRLTPVNTADDAIAVSSLVGLISRFVSMDTYHEWRIEYHNGEHVGDLEGNLVVEIFLF